MDKIADLHCDLLCYLAGSKERTACDPAVRCSIPQLNEGNVRLQILPVFVDTCPASSQMGSNQVRMFGSLQDRHPESFEFISNKGQLEVRNKIGIMIAFENASGFCGEGDSLNAALNSLERLETKITYISMTWNSVNRFGGGAGGTVGLRKDGETLLHFLHQRKIAIDLSHASDPLAFDILNYIDKKQLDIPVIASHSNFRAVTDVPRNLPDELVKEITARKGIIGINFVRPFLGPASVESFKRHFEHGLSLKANLCFGADFFFGDDVPLERRRKPDEWYFPGYHTAACYSKVLDLWNLTHEMRQAIAYKNLQTFLETQILS